jgi:hypothetical protein
MKFQPATTDGLPWTLCARDRFSFSNSTACPTIAAVTRGS